MDTNWGAKLHVSDRKGKALALITMQSGSLEEREIGSKSDVQSLADEFRVPSNAVTYEAGVWNSLPD